jgi:PAS domain S-box-containing protein
MELYEREKKYRYIAENSKDIICTVEIESLKYIYVSNACLKETGYTKEEHMQLSLHDVLPPESIYEVQAIVDKAIDVYEKLQRKYETNFELQRYHANGHLY